MFDQSTNETEIVIESPDISARYVGGGHSLLRGLIGTIYADNNVEGALDAA